MQVIPIIQSPSAFKPVNSTCTCLCSFTCNLNSFPETIENYELEDYIEEILFNEFHTVAEDGSLPKVSEIHSSFIF